ncbi:MAG: hypothetical protein HC836_39465 [Richelia sp. RM2_1_2]|nr:hypothetical protein [Richelia sp. RM2_1_2]
MKVDINIFKPAPKHVAASLQLCVYGQATKEIHDWCDHWNLTNSIRVADGYTNIPINDSVSLEEMFTMPQKFEYVDGFSPNLNKHLHIGHFSNLVLAKAYQSMGTGKMSVAIFGDTLPGEVKKNDALEAYERYCRLFKYRVDKSFMASDMRLKDFSRLQIGEGEYGTTKIFDIDGEK